jgi:hypothetical protein
MATIDRWKVLSKKWNSLLGQAVSYQEAMDDKMIAFFSGKGANPTEAEYKVGLELWEKEKQARDVLQDFIADHLGHLN